MTRGGRLRRLRSFDTRLCFVGHSHLPGTWSLGSSGPEHRAGAVDVELERGRRYSSTSAASGSRAIATRARPTRSGTSSAARSRFVASPTMSRRRARRSCARDCRGSWLIGSRGAPEPASVAASCPRPPGHAPVFMGLALSSNGLGRVAWVAARAADRRSRCASRLAQAFAWGWARRHGVLPGPPAVAQLHLQDVQHDSWPLTGGPTLALAGYCGLYVGAVRRRGRVARAALDRLGALRVAVPVGRRRSGYAATSSAAFPGVSLGYSQYPRLPVIQIAELGGVYAVSFLIVAINAAVAGGVRAAPGAAALVGRRARRRAAGTPRSASAPWRLARARSRPGRLGWRSCSRRSSSRSSSTPRHAATTLAIYLDPDAAGGRRAARR